MVVLGSAIRWMWLATAVIIVGCGLPASGDVTAARHLADEYLSALAGGVRDRGWSLILPDSRRAYADLDQYLALASAADWTQFSWDLVEEGDYCEDGGVYCVVRIQFDDAPDAIPSFLLSSPESRQDDMFWTVRLDDDVSTAGNAEMVVYFTPGGPSGILLGGG